MKRKNQVVRQTSLNIYVGEDYYMTRIEKRIVGVLLERNSPIGTFAKSDRKTAELLEHDTDAQTGKVRISWNERNDRGEMDVCISTHTFSYKRIQQAGLLDG